MTGCKILREFLDICPVCAETQPLNEIQRNENYPVGNGKRVEIEAVVLECSVCKEVFATTDQEQANYVRAISVMEKGV